MFDLHLTTGSVIRHAQGSKSMKSSKERMLTAWARKQHFQPIRDWTAPVIV